MSRQGQKGDFDYGKLLSRPEWKRKRAAVLAESPRCEKCGKKSPPLAVHHRRYIFGLKPWEYPDDVYMVVCNGRCHLEADEDREEQELNAKNERAYGWQGELGRFYRRPRGTQARMLRDHKVEFTAWLTREGIIHGEWDWEAKPLWFLWNALSDGFLAARKRDDPQGVLPL